MIIRASTAGPMKFAISRRERRIVDAGDARSHQTMLIELPVLISVAAIPLPGIIVPLVGETHRDAIFPKGPQLLDQAVIQLTVPLAFQERPDGLTTLKELGAIAPATVGGVGERDPRR